MIHAPRFSTATQSIFVLCILATALFFGGVAWAQVFLTAAVLRSRPEFRGERLLLMACSLIWLVIFRWFFVRQLFFPYTMHLATCALLFASDFEIWRGYIRGMIVVAVFLAIRFLQGATNRVLGIELIVAAVILAFAICFYQLTPKNAVSRAIVVVVASLTAVAGLTL
ncbi:MAG: hypothetical protein WCO86_00255 [Planctomycetota bacterium]